MSAPLAVVSGASGFVGSHIVDELLRQGARVRDMQVCIRVSGDLRDRFDVVLYDPRGVGRSEGLRCALDIPALLDLDDNLERLRTQLSELELQAEAQMGKQQEAAAHAQEFDPLEFDRYTRFTELTQSSFQFPRKKLVGYPLGINRVGCLQCNLVLVQSELPVPLSIGLAPRFPRCFYEGIRNGSACKSKLGH